LKADPRRLVERYFDAFLYLANWGTHRLTFRLPAEAFGRSTTAVVEQYLVGNYSTAWTTGGHVIIDLVAEDDDGGYDEEWLDGSGLLASIVPVRAELMTGDLRLLYLAWLLAVQNREVDEDEFEPPVPRGLGQLSAAAEFLRIDSDLVAVAAEGSAPAGVDDTLTELSNWLAQLPAESKDVLLLRVARRDGARVCAELLAGCCGAAGSIQVGNVGGRTAGRARAVPGAPREPAACGPGASPTAGRGTSQSGRTRSRDPPERARRAAGAGVA
jgi:hypothetical protein